MATGGGSDTERGTDETFDFLCSVCKGKNKNTEGDLFCVDCHDYYCSTCVKCHSEIPVLKNHKILNKAQFKTSSGGQFPAVLTERCKVHKHKPVDMYCKQHNTVICSICMVNQHSGCHDKFYVPDYIKNNTDTVNSNIADQLDTIANNLAELQDTFIKDKERLKSCKEKSLKQIQKYRKEINQMLDELEKKTINDLDQRIQSLNDKIEANLRELQATMSDVLTAQDSLKSARGNTAQTFVSIKMANAIVSHAQEKAHTHTSQDTLTEIDFVPHEKLQSILNEIQALGVIGLTETLRSKATTEIVAISSDNQSKHTAPTSVVPVTDTKTSAISSEHQSKHTAPTSVVPVTETKTSAISSEHQSKHTAPTSVVPVTETKTSAISSEHQSKHTAPTSVVPVTETETVSISSEHQSKHTAPTSVVPVTETETSAISSEHQSKHTAPTSVVPVTEKQSPQSNPSLLKIKGKKTYSVKVKSDSKTCDIQSACILADGTIILADYDNRQLKRVNSTSYTVTDYCGVLCSPWQVCVITDQKVAVSCTSRKLIQFVSIGRTMQKTRQIYTGFECYALAYADKKMFVSDYSTSVYVYSVSGDRQQQFSMDQSGQQIFSDIRSLAVSSDHSMIYVADWNKGLIILDRTGQLVGRFNGPELKGARDVCLYSNDSVLVSGCSSKNVLQLSLDGKLLGEVLKTNGSCLGVCCNSSNTKLIVSLYYNDDIEVHDINCE